MFRFFVCICFLHVVNVDSARILGVFPVPSLSHQIVFRALTHELAKRGHELVIITTDPAFPEYIPKNNITEINVSFGYQRLMDIMTEGRKANVFQRGIKQDSWVHTVADIRNKTMVPIVVEMIENSAVRKYTRDKNQKFDLVIAEAFMTYHLILSKIFNAPLILFSSFHGIHNFFEAIGAPTRHPLLYPSIFNEIYNGANVFDRFKQIKFEFDYFRAMKKIEVFENEALKEHYGPNAPTAEELRSNVDMLFLNSNPIFCGNRPLPPNAVYIGPIHLKPVKDLPQELKLFLENSKTGVIYVSMGTNVRPSMMDQDLLDSFVNAFGELPYDVLWKFDGDNIKNLPKNVKIQAWFPQRDLLLHPNIKLFVTQGGLQSTDEAIDAGVPLVGIPLLADQYHNTHRYEQLGIGVKLDILTLDKHTLLDGINTVMNNDSYKENIKRLKKVLNDQPQTPIERAVWWTEYVIRHGGAKHLKSPAATMTWAEYLMLDVILLFVFVFVVAAILAFKVIKSALVKLIKNAKEKQN